jgi:micrococcal nuclease
MAAVILAIVIAAAARGGDGSPSAAAPTPTAARTQAVQAATPAATLSVALPGIHPDPARLQRAEVTHIVDGDTIDVQIDGREERVRYYGIDTPERGQPCFGEATERNSQLVAQNVMLLPDARERDRYGRLLRYVFDASGVSIDARLVGEGYAHAWRQDGTYRDQLVALEAETQAAQTGCLWATGAP